MKPLSQSWYIRLARKLGAKTDIQALRICLFVSIVLIIITILFYRELFFTTQTSEPIDPVLLRSMERGK